MLTGLFLWPGRLVAGLFSSDRKKEYRSRRQRAETTGRVVLLSLVLWLAGAGVLLFALDRTGLLKEALDAGVEVAQGERPAEPASAPESPPAPEPASVPEPAPAAAPPALAPVETTAGDLPAPTEEAPPAVEAEMWLVILHSIPKSGRHEAERRQAGYKAKGLAVEILDTNAFPKLPPDYWIIALGPFDRRAEALTAADKAKAFNSGIMVRRGL